MSRHFRAPTANGEVLADPPFEAVPALVEANRKRLDRTDVVIGGLPLRDLRALARREALVLDVSVSRDRQGAGQPPSREVIGPLPAGRGSIRSHDAPLLLTGHQPELSHPGVWAKNFALNGLARRLGGVPMNLVVDNDTLKSTSLRFPTFHDRDPGSVRLESLAFDTFGGELPYEDSEVRDPELFRTFPERAAPLWANWGYEPLLASAWSFTDPGARAGPIGERLVLARLAFECDWGCNNAEVFVSALAHTEAFARFAGHILADLPRFRDVYNRAIRAYRAANGVRSANHPAPELADGEAPFWVRAVGGRRSRATPASDVRTLRPRALTLTLFARVCLGDFFIHGIGGGKYDEVTDAIIRDYFGLEPPAYQVVSATLHLPLPTFPSTAADLDRARRRVRDLRWNPQFALPPSALTEAHAALAESEPPRGDHAARREWFRTLQESKERMRVLVADEVPGAEAELARVRGEVAANALMRRRDFPWVLYPERTLRPFLQRFLSV